MRELRNLFTPKFCFWCVSALFEMICTANSNFNQLWVHLKEGISLRRNRDLAKSYQNSSTVDQPYNGKSSGELNDLHRMANLHIRVPTLIWRSSGGGGDSPYQGSPPSDGDPRVGGGFSIWRVGWVQQPPPSFPATH